MYDVTDKWFCTCRRPYRV